MIAVLISNASSASPWVSRRSSKAIHVKGMAEGDHLVLALEGESFSEKEFFSDETFILPEWCLRVRAHHIRASGSRVCIDLR